MQDHEEFSSAVSNIKDVDSLMRAALLPDVDYVKVFQRCITKARNIRGGGMHVLSQELLKEMTGNFWNRRYRMPSNYPCMEDILGLYGWIMLSGMDNFMTGEAYENDRSLSNSLRQLRLIRHLMKWEMPFFLLDENTAGLLDYFDVDNLFDVVNVNFPFPAFTIVLPDSVNIPLNMTFESDVKARLWGITLERVLHQGGQLGLTITLAHDRMSDNAGGPISIDTRVVEGFVDMEEFGSLGAGGVIAQKDLISCLQLVSKVLLVLEHRPESLQPEKNPKMIGKRGKEITWLDPKTLVLPTMKVMRGDRELTEEEVERTRPHKHAVRQHLRQQPWGPGRTLTKTILILPFWKCVDNPREA